MPDDYYSAPDEGTPASGTAKPADKPTGDENEMEGDTALMPKSMFGGKLPDVGQEFIFKVEHVYEDEVEVSYAKGEGKDEEKPEGDKSMMASADDAFDQMANPTGKE